MKKINLFETVEVTNKLYYGSYRVKYIQIVPFFNLFNDHDFERECKRKGTKYTLLEFFYDEETNEAFTNPAYYAVNMKDMQRYIEEEYRFYN